MLLQWTRNDDLYMKAVYYVLLSTVVCLAFDIRFVNTLSIIMLPALVFIHPQRGRLFRQAFSNPFFLSFFFLYLLQIAGLFYTGDQHEGLKDVTKKASFAALPFFFCAITSIPATMMRKLMIGFSLSLFLVSLSCLAIASYRYLHGSNSSVFFYHNLVAPFIHHAIFFSFFIFFAIQYWVSDGLPQLSKKWRNAMVLLLIFFLGMIILLSSKLVLIITLVYLVGFALNSIARKKMNWLLPLLVLVVLAGLFLVMFTNNPVKRRFTDLTTGNKELFRQEQFAPDIYFNGLQFRLLTWRFTYEILEKRQAWILGVSPGDAQHELNNRYTETRMYMGEGAKTGFQNFNCHNVYLQTLLESGITGLVLLLTGMISFIIIAFRRKKYNALLFFATIIAFGFTESVLSSQYTILLVLFFPPLLLIAERPRRKG